MGKTSTALAENEVTQRTMIKKGKLTQLATRTINSFYSCLVYISQYSDFNKPKHVKS
ncbi:hypothetical protein GCM10009409_02420 [Shewanella saliphila]|uniref:Uncharacterized protein n=1 Tax=Shewanella saliphila TaxID=2282698 RepID=A0ABQ2Q1Z6_9GAMM|nr:hypothetical protein GCM10009409_02420 [Shewanella saliphila]